MLDLSLIADVMGMVFGFVVVGIVLLVWFEINLVCCCGYCIVVYCLCCWLWVWLDLIL